MLGSRSDFPIGADVYAIGHPTGQAWSYTKGIVSQVRDNFTWGTDEEIKHHADVIQTQTPINPGNSGGPLLSDDGKLVGVNSFKAAGEALNFAVTVDEVRRFLEETSTAERPDTKSSCSPKLLFEGRNNANDAFIRRFSLRCDAFADLVYVLPDKVSEPLWALFDTKRRDKADICVIDGTRSGNWKISYWDVDFDDTFPLKGIHQNGDLKPVRFEKRCPGKAAPNFKCL